jgi:hypothetical protein
MLIKYKPKSGHLKCVPLIPATAELKQIKLTRTQVSLLPGTNEVTDDEWKIMKARLAREIERGEIIAADPAKAHNLKDMKPSQAAVLAAGCVNPDTLKKWYREETRQEIRLAIVEKMKELNIDIPKFTPGEGGGEDDEDEYPEKEDDDGALEEMTAAELKAYAAERHITVSGGKAEIIAAIREAEAK